MITYSSIILIILAILLLVVIAMKVTFTSSSFNFKKNIMEQFSSEDADVVFFGNDRLGNRDGRCEDRAEAHKRIGHARCEVAS